jgi:hypothetical protein
MSIYLNHNHPSPGMIRHMNIPEYNPNSNLDKRTHGSPDHSDPDIGESDKLHEIVDRVRQLERLVADALLEESDGHINILRQRNSELEGILNLLKSQLCENVNQLLLAVEEERALREEAQAEVEALKARFKAESLRMHEVGVKSQSQDRQENHDTSDQSVLQRKVSELEAECDMLRTLIKDQRTSS